MTFAKKQIFFISLILSLSIFFAPLAQEVYAESILSKVKTKASELITKYTSRDFLVDKASSAIATNVIAKPVKLATSALGIAIGTAVGGPVGATLGAYIGNSIGTNLCKVVAKPIVKGIMNEQLDNGGKLTLSSIFKVCKSLDKTSLACDTTGAVIGDILGGAIGGILGAAITACVGGGTILPIVGTITFATLGSKYGKKFGTWLGKKIGEKFFNKSYKALTGIDRTEDQSASSNILFSTASDIASVDKTKVVCTTTGEIVGDVIGSTVGTVIGATVSAVTTGGTSDTITNLGTSWGSKIGVAIGKWFGNKFYNKTSEIAANKAAAKSASVSNKNVSDTSTTTNNNNSVTISTGSNATVSVADSITESDLDAVYRAYLTSYEIYTKAMNNNNTTPEQMKTIREDYNRNYTMYKKVFDEYQKNKN